MQNLGQSHDPDFTAVSEAIYRLSTPIYSCLLMVEAARGYATVVSQSALANRMLEIETSRLIYF